MKTDKMKTNIENKNHRGQYHGYQEWYGEDNGLAFRSTCKNNLYIGYSEAHLKFIKQTYFNIR
jgi:hypothetical protein